MPHYDLRNLLRQRVHAESQPVYSPPKYLCVFCAEPVFPTLNTEYLYRTIDAAGLMTLVRNIDICGIQNLHLYLIRHDKPPLPVDYLLRGNSIMLFDRCGNYVERSVGYA